MYGESTKWYRCYERTASIRSQRHWSGGTCEDQSRQRQGQVRDNRVEHEYIFTLTKFCILLLRFLLCLYKTKDFVTSWNIACWRWFATSTVIFNCVYGWAWVTMLKNEYRIWLEERGRRTKDNHRNYSILEQYIHLPSMMQYNSELVFVFTDL